MTQRCYRHVGFYVYVCKLRAASGLLPIATSLFLLLRIFFPALIGNISNVYLYAKSAMIMNPV